jgi:arsenate reductase
MVLWFNPSCSKCRAALELLRGRGIEPTIREYLRERPTESELLALLRKLPDPSRAVRTGEDQYGASGLSAFSSPAQLALAISREPILLERPILELPDRAIIARPPEKLLELLSE